jgi:hypothetical protein
LAERLNSIDDARDASRPGAQPADLRDHFWPGCRWYSCVVVAHVRERQTTSLHSEAVGIVSRAPAT